MQLIESCVGADERNAFGLDVREHEQDFSNLMVRTGPLIIACTWPHMRIAHVQGVSELRCGPPPD